MAAAAVPANQLVAFFLVRAQPQPANQPANQLYFDVALANQRQPFFTDIKFDVLTPPGLPIASGGPVTQQELQDVAATATAPAVPAWRRFLTFLCQSFQFEEQALLQARRTRITNLLLIPGNLPNWQFFRPPPNGFPESTCTCLAWLEGPLNMVYCIDCRQHRACTRHDSRLMVRQQNDAWLRRIDRGPNGLKFAHKNKINGRRNRGVFRACRCGAEVLFNGHWSPQVFLCMGCEGVFHLAHYAGTNVAPPILARRTIVNTRSKARASDVLARTSKEFKLRREI
ncbi:hypothetical protein B0A55_09418 [Friedmanniomyces simplex]|uniref:Uncharacterized protein n=1 Tax=Friedmanniomyces simplex TaxID=329884 RepID=A0A4U0WWU4_9PEZI|nr:hypothetical protein B0A55_09418 [Friedmanniomyces simplex]